MNLYSQQLRLEIQGILISWMPRSLAAFTHQTIVDPDFSVSNQFSSGGKIPPSFSLDLSHQHWLARLGGSAARASLHLRRLPPIGCFGLVTDICLLSAMSASTSVSGDQLGVWESGQLKPQQVDTKFLLWVPIVDRKLKVARTLFAATTSES